MIFQTRDRLKTMLRNKIWYLLKETENELSYFNINKCGKIHV